MNQYIAMKPYVELYKKSKPMATIIVNGAQKIKYIFLNKVKISFKSTFYN